MNDKSADPQQLATTQADERESLADVSGGNRFALILHNDESNAMDYVADTLFHVLPFKPYQAHQKMEVAHRDGSCTLMTTHQQEAEVFRDQLRSKGLIVTIEPA
jgi:ATP-dependent Clp protease adapter protein ClpS